MSRWRSPRDPGDRSGQGVDELMEGGGKRGGLRMESRAGSKVKEGDCKEWEGE